MLAARFLDKGDVHERSGVERGIFLARKLGRPLERNQRSRQVASGSLGTTDEVMGKTVAVIVHHNAAIGPLGRVKRVVGEQAVALEELRGTTATGAGRFLGPHWNIAVMLRIYPPATALEALP